MTAFSISSIKYCRLIFAIVVISLVSCETSKDNASDESTKIDQVLRINFDENINSLHPLEAKSKSELFVRQVIFDLLIEQDGTSHILESITLDSASQTYHFRLHATTTFSDGSAFTTADLHQIFIELFDSYQTNPTSTTLLQSVQGGKYYSLLPSNQLPRGIQMIDTHHFTMTPSYPFSDLIELVKSTSIPIYKTNGQAYFGTTKFHVDQLNEDRSCTITRNTFEEKTINQLLIRFIKNQTVLLSEFKLNELDLISYNSYPTDSSETKKILEATTRSKYPNYQVYQAANKTLRYAHISANDSAQIDRILSSLKHEWKELRSFVRSEENQYSRTKLPTWNNQGNEFDSSAFEIKVEQPSNFTLSDYFTETDSISFSIDRDFTDLSNPTQPKIVINEISVKSQTDTAFLEKIMNITYVSRRINLIVILKEYPTYYIVNNNLKGLQNFQSLESQLNSLYFSRPKQY